MNAAIRLAAALSFAAAATPHSPAAVIWIEGESAWRHNLQYNDWIKGDYPDQLSGRNAFCSLNQRRSLPYPGYILWRFQVAEAGSYHVYIRHGWRPMHGQVRFRFLPIDPITNTPTSRPGIDEGWINFSDDAPFTDAIQIGEWRQIGWVRYGPVDLLPGNYILDLQIIGIHAERRTDAETDIWALYDVICLTTTPFIPNGTTRPPG